MPFPKNKYAWTVKVGTKGQIVIPKEARDLFSIKEGDSILILGDAKRGLAIPKKDKLFDLTKSVFKDSND